jgi:hypothetical protein
MFTDLPAFFAGGLLFVFLVLPFLPGILYFDAIECFIEMVGVHVGKYKLIWIVEDEPGERLALLLVKENLFLKNSYVFLFVARL